MSAMNTVWYLASLMGGLLSAAECAVCHGGFLSEEAFDIHRGINKKRAYRTGNGEDDERQDLGRCRTVREMNDNGLTTFDGRWGTQSDISLAQRMKSMRAAKGK